MMKIHKNVRKSLDTARKNIQKRAPDHDSFHYFVQSQTRAIVSRNSLSTCLPCPGRVVSLLVLSHCAPARAVPALAAKAVFSRPSCRTISYFPQESRIFHLLVRKVSRHLFKNQKINTSLISKM